MINLLNPNKITIKNNEISFLQNKFIDFKSLAIPHKKNFLTNNIGN